jgi:4'-phosphopantetheinyl transferase
LALLTWLPDNAPMSPAPFSADPPRLAWTLIQAPPLLQGDALHLWLLDLAAAGPAADALAVTWLSARQRARLARLHAPHLRWRYLRAQAGCRAVLARYLGSDPAALRFRYGDAGKPMLDGCDTDLTFNLSTTGDIALLAVSLGLPVGVDCELLRERPAALAVARRMFPQAVAEALPGLPPTARRQAFYLQWTALEARVKADGRGLARHREQDLPGLRVAHAWIDHGGGDDARYVCAVARQQLPPPQQWQTYLLAKSRGAE